MQQVLRKALVCESICEVDTSDGFYIHNPYSGQPTTVVQALTGTYTPAAWTITDDSLTITDEFIVSEHVFDFERVLNDYALIQIRSNEMAFSVRTAIDRFVLNNLTEDGTGTYTTPAGGFSAANTPIILSNLVGKVAGFDQMYKGLFLVIENTDMAGFLQWEMSTGFSFADAALRNGLYMSPLGIDVYVVRTGTFADETLGTKTYTNLGHRVFGVKKMATYCEPRGVTSVEKPVSGKTGLEIETHGYIGFKLWAQVASLIIDITLA